MLKQLPNAITLSRIALIPVIGSSILAKNYSATFPLFAYCAASDLADGWLARRLKCKSKLGSVLDPLADKLLIGTLAGCLWKNSLLSNATVGIVLGRDLLLLTGAAGLALRNNSQKFEVKPFLSSKINTSLQLLLLGIAIWEGIESEKEEDKKLKQLKEGRKIIERLVWFSTIWSGCSYALHFRKSMKFK
jgi:cardiolipin synthase